MKKELFARSEVRFETVDPVTFIQEYLNSYQQVTENRRLLRKDWKITCYQNTDVIIQEWFQEMIMGSSGLYSKTLIQFPELISVTMLVWARGIYIDACIVRLDVRLGTKSSK